YRKYWAGFPDFKVRVKRLLAVGENTIVTENECSGTHLGKFLCYPPTGKYVRLLALGVWHFKGKRLRVETVFFDMARVLKKIGDRITIPLIDEKPSDAIKDPRSKHVFTSTIHFLRAPIAIEARNAIDSAFAGFRFPLSRAGRDECPPARRSSHFMPCPSFHNLSFCERAFSCGRSHDQ